jgi:cytoskeletal protein RodZ
LHYLQALEADDYEKIPSKAQARGFLRAYADYLGLIPNQLLAALEGVPEEVEAPSPVGLDPTTTGLEETESVEVIYVEIGQQLHKQRELLGLSLEDVERHTHLRTRYLQAIEAGNFDDLPSSVQGRGMLNNYANFLGLDPEPLLLRFAQSLQMRLAAKQAALSPTRPRTRTAPRSRRSPSFFRRVLSGEFLLGVLLVISLGLFAIWGTVRIFAMRAEVEEPVPTAPSIADVLLASPTVTLTNTPLPPSATVPVLAQVTEQTPLVEEIGGLPAGQGVRVYVTVRQRTWVRVVVDGKSELDGRVIPGTAYQFAGGESIEIITGNGAGIQIFFNQQDLGPMGEYGEVVHRIFTRDGILAPTPTITPTPTRTQRPTSTPAAGN